MQNTSTPQLIVSKNKGYRVGKGFVSRNASRNTRGRVQGEVPLIRSLTYVQAVAECFHLFLIMSIVDGQNPVFSYLILSCGVDRASAVLMQTVQLYQAPSFSANTRTLDQGSLAQPNSNIAQRSGCNPICRLCFVPGLGNLKSNQIAEHAITTYRHLVKSVDFVRRQNFVKHCVVTKVQMSLRSSQNLAEIGTGLQ